MQKRPASQTVMGCVPTVSVIMPVYQIAAYVGEAIGSVIGQTLANWELICVDDGSDDGSREICEAFALDDPRIIVIRQQHEGLGSARNRGIRYARGRYLYFLDGDDMIVPEALQTCMEAADTSEADMVQFGARVIVQDGRRHNANKYIRSRSYPGVWNGAELYLAQRQARDYIAQACTYVSRADVFHDDGVLFPEGIIHEDEYATYRALTQARRVVCLDNLLYMRRYRTHSIMSDQNWRASVRGYFRSYALIVSEDVPASYCASRSDAHDLFLDTMACACITSYCRGDRSWVDFPDVVGAGEEGELVIEGLLVRYAPCPGLFPLPRAAVIALIRIRNARRWLLWRLRSRSRSGSVGTTGVGKA